MSLSTNGWGEILSRTSVQALIMANTVPLIGVLFFDWSLFGVVFLFWLENVIIGIFNVLRLYRAEGNTKEGRWFLIFFFCLHYGIFTMGHWAFITALFGPFDLAPITLLAAVGALLISHGISYRLNFIGKGEYKHVTDKVLFTQPYKRIVILHLSIMSCVFIILLLGTSLLALVLFIFLKVIIDIWAHTRERVRFSPGEEVILAGK